MTLGQWMTIWLAALLVFVVSAHRIMISRLRTSKGYQAIVTGEPESDFGEALRGGGSVATNDQQ